MKKHRNSQKRIYFEDAVYFVTSVTRNRYPYFKEKIFADIFVENLRMSKVLKQFRLYGWFLGYDHFHALIQPGDEYSISEVMFSIKKQISHNINIILGKNRPYVMPEGAQSIARLRSGGGTDAELIAMHDKCIVEFKNVFLRKYSYKKPCPFFQWQKSYHDHVIRDDFDFENHFEYIQFNPEKHDLPKDWLYVSEHPKFIDLIDDYEG